MEKQEFRYLFTPLKIGTVTVPNRIVMTGAVTRFTTGITPPNERQVRYFEARAKGGVGLITSSPHYPFGLNTMLGSLGYRSIYESDDAIPALKKITDAIHQYPTKVFGQLSHPGARWARASGGGAGWAPSALPRRPFLPGPQDIPYEMDKDDIRRGVKAYGAMALRMKKAGFDGLEIMAMIGMLQASFLAPLLNIRTDEYGGSLENRMRFLLETIDAIREAVGPDFPLGVRFTGDELMDRVWWTKNKGQTLDDTKETAKRLEATGKLDYLFPCATIAGPAHIPPMQFPLGAFTYIAAGIKEVVDLPVFTVGRINDPVLAERILADNQADMVGMTRAVIADPELPNKAREGRLEEIRRCIGCNEGCIGPVYMMPLSCSLNYEAGREQMGPIEPAETKKSVMVIGGGAAGLETARVAARRGHKVSLYEKNDALAKELSIAAKAPGREDFAEAKRYFTYQMKLLNVDVHLGVTVTPEMVIEQKPDAVVVATGAVPFIPEIPGANNHNVVETRQVLLEEVEVGQNVLVVDYQNHMHGLDVADFLAERGKKVELIAEPVVAGSALDGATLETAYTIVLSKGVVITPLTWVKEIQSKTIIVYNVLTNAERQIEGIDTVVVCTDGRADDSLYHSLKGKVKELYQVGQCVSPRRLLDSIADAYVTARAL